VPIQKSKGGRPSKIENAALIEQMIRLIESGCPLYDAARTAGISRAALKRWLARGRQQKDGRFRALLDRVETARSKGVVLLVTRIRLASEGTADKPGDWRAAAWLLSRLDPKHYGDPSWFQGEVRGKVRHRHKHEARGEASIKDMSDEELEQQLREA